MNELIPMEYHDQRIITTKVLAEQFGTDEKNISKNFTRNEGRFQEGKHYYKIEGEELKEFKGYHLNDESLKFVSVLYLWTEKGAARHAKILETDEAWQVYEALEDTYFRVKNQAKKIEGGGMKVITLLHAEIGELINITSTHGQRIESLENTMTIDYSQQLVLQQIAKYVAVEAMGGKNSKTYKDKSVSSKVFAQVWKDYKEYFEVNSYKNTARVEFERAKEYLKGWKAQGAILREIETTNQREAN